MGILASLHERYIFTRRINVLADHISTLIPKNARVLDVGCGDGRLDRLLTERRTDLQIKGIDTLIRPETFIPVSVFDGKTLPFPDDAFDVVVLVDVLHHTEDPLILLAESARVALRFVIIKDHKRDGVLAESILRFMDWIGNARHGVALPYNYLSSDQWDEAFNQSNLKVERCISNLKIYQQPFSLFFDRQLHFISRLRPSLKKTNNDARNQ